MNKEREKGKEEIKLRGLIFFGKYSSIREQLPHYHLDYINRINPGAKRWSDRVATGDLNYLNLNLYQFFIAVLEKLKLTLYTEYELDEELSISDIIVMALVERVALSDRIIH